MVEITKDRKSDTYIITKTDSEGVHKQMNVTHDDLGKIVHVLKQNKYGKIEQCYQKLRGLYPNLRKNRTIFKSAK